jgi:hypothetical protein
MPIPTWSVGQVLSASDVNTWFVPLNVIKPSGQTVTSSTALVNDSALVLAVVSNSVYCVQGAIQYNAASGGDLKYTFTVPAGASGFYGWTATNITAFNGGASSAWTDTNTGQGNGTSTFMNIRITGVLNVGGASGNLQFRWAQNTSSGTATTVMGNSALLAYRIA